MSRAQSNCPQCGAPVEFKWSSSVQTTCEYCHSIIVRSDLDVKKVGTVADLPPDASPLQLNSEGVYNNKAFVVIGRIIYDYEQGSWNEWHLMFHEGTSGWLSDAQLEYAISFLSDAKQALPPSSEVSVGRKFEFNGETYEVTSITQAHYRGVEGELPFEYWDKVDVPFIDLRTTSGKFATIDYSDEPPILFLGEPVDFDALHLKNLKEFEGWVVG